MTTETPQHATLVPATGFGDVDASRVDAVRIEELREIVSRRRWLLYLSGGLTFLFAGMDWLAIGHWSHVLLLMRLGMGLFLGVCGGLVGRLSTGALRALLMAQAVVVTIWLTVAVSLIGDVYSPVLVVLPLAYALYVPGALHVALTAGFAGLLCRAGLFLMDSSNPAYAWNSVAISLALSSIAIYAAVDQRRSHRARVALRLREQAAKTDLQESEARLALAFELSPVAVSLRRFTDHRYVSVNPAFTRLTGYSASEAVGRTAVELGIASAEEWAHLVPRFTESELVHLEAGGRNRHGAPTQVIIHARLVQLQGTPYLLSFIEDVTERRETEHAQVRLQDELRRANEAVRRVLDNAPIVLSAIDGAGVITFADGRGLRRLGLAPGEPVGRNVLAMFPQEPSVRATIEQALSGKPCETLSHVNALDQDWQIWWTPLTSPSGELAGAVSVGIEVTERVKAAEELRRTEESLRSVIERVPDLIVVETGGRIVYGNQAAREATGLTQEQLAQRSLLELLHPDDREAVVTRIQEMGRPGHRPHRIELRAVRADGSLLWVEAMAVRALFEGKESLFVVARDTTERRRMEEKLRISDRMVTVGTLAAGVAHEINNPLTYVLGYLHMARDRIVQAAETDPAIRPALPGVAEALATAIQGADRVRHIVRDLKTFSYPEETGLGQVDLHAVLDFTLNMVWNQLHHRAEVIRDFGPVPLLLGNESRLGQVFLNLLVNAAQAIPDGSSQHHAIRLVTRFEEASQLVRVEVQDDGAGISPEHLSHIFEPFFTTKEVGTGTGLGLSICHGLVQSMGGTISVESTLGVGSVFTVRLPVGQQETLAMLVPKPVRPVARRRARVLAIDDEPAVLALLDRTLRPAHDFTGQREASEALALISNGASFDVILCDLMMPHMNGMEFYAELTRRSPEQAAHVVFLTGGAFTEASREFLTGKAVLDKPFDFDALLALVQASATRHPVAA